LKNWSRILSLSDKNLLFLLAYNGIPNITPYRKLQILEALGGIEGFVEVIKGKVQGSVSPTLIRKISNDLDLDWAKREAKLIAKNEVRILTLEDDSYPALLKEISDPPIILYVIGELPTPDKACLGVVGARRMTPYGQMVTEKICQGLAGAGVVIVSGMARGIDTIAHRSALDAGGATVGVLGSGLRVIYPPENRGIYNQISKSGALISEFPLTAQPLPYHFPRRNRIISGLCHGVLVTEAASKSGSLITADFALEQDRSVYAIPGRIVDQTSCGTNRLLQEGATPVNCMEDILVDLKGLNSDLLKYYFNNGKPSVCEDSKSAKGKKALKGQKDHAMRPIPDAWCDISDAGKNILEHLGSDPIHIDELTNLVDLKDQDIYSILMELEFRGLVRSLSGTRFIKEIV
jgi:DNA processing protein